MKIQRLDAAKLAKLLGDPRQPVGPQSLADQVVLTLPARDFLPGPVEGASPVARLGLQVPPFKITTGQFSVGISATVTGVFELFGGALVAGTDQATKDTNNADPPNRDFELWGFSSAFLKVRDAFMEMGWILSTERVAFTFDGPELLHDLNNLHSSQGWNGKVSHFMLNEPYLIPANTELTWEYTIVNLEAAARNAQIVCRFYWRYA